MIKNRTITDQRKFNLMDYNELRVDFDVAGSRFTTFLSEDAAEKYFNLQLYHPDLRPAQTFSCSYDITRKAKAGNAVAEVNLREGETADVEFTFDDQALFIIRVNGQDSSIWFLTYDIRGDELTPLCIRKPGVERSDKSIEAQPERDFIFGAGYEIEWWIGEVMQGGQRAIEALLEFTDRLFHEGHDHARAKSDLDELRRALFKESSTCNAAFRLYERRHYIGHEDYRWPDQIIEKIITDQSSGFPGDDQKGGKADES